MFESSCLNLIFCDPAQENLGLGSSLNSNESTADGLHLKTRCYLQRRVLLGLEFDWVYLPLSLVDMLHATSGVFGS
jgi:hypothetical protein